MKIIGKILVPFVIFLFFILIPLLNGKQSQIQTLMKYYSSLEVLFKLGKFSFFFLKTKNMFVLFTSFYE